VLKTHNLTQNLDKINAEESQAVFLKFMVSLVGAKF